MSHKSRRRHPAKPAKQEPLRLQPDEQTGHGPRQRRGGPPPRAEEPHQESHAAAAHDQPWLPTSGLVGRSRRSARRQ